MALTPAQAIATIKQTRDVVVAIQNTVMIPGVHYGTLPGVPRPFLTKDGAEVLCQAFSLVPREEGVEDLSSEREAKYRVIIGLYNQSGERVGFGMGICSSEEKKFASQARADVENTILQQAIKRAYVQATRQRLATSDLFHAIDIGDMSETDRANLSISATRRPAVGAPRAKPPVVVPTSYVQKRAEPLPPNMKMSTGAEPEWMKDDPSDPGPAQERRPPAMPYIAGVDEPEAAEAHPPLDLYNQPSYFSAGDWEAVKNELHQKGAISSKQEGRLFGIARSAGWTEPEVRREIAVGLRLEADEIPWGRPYEMVVALFEQPKVAQAELLPE